MTQRSFSQDEQNRISHSNSPTQPIENIGSPESSLRADMVLGSQAIPAERNIYGRARYRFIVRFLLVGMILVGLGYLIAGQGRRSLESGLMGLINDESPGKSPVSAVSSPVSSKTPTASITPTTTSTPTTTITPHPTVTLIIVNLPTRTHTPVINRTSATPTMVVQVTDTVEPECKEALSVTLKDVGKNLCVQGTVINLISNETNFMVIFSSIPGAFYWVAYDLAWVNGEIDKCYQVDGTINQILNTPVLVFNYNNLPRECP